MKCTTCGINLIGQDEFVKFKCPQCSETTIVRCKKCKKMSKIYTCSKCKFEGP